MSDKDDSGLYQFAEAVFNKVAATANPVLERRLAERGVAMEALPQAEQLDLLKTAFAEATAGAALEDGQEQLRLILHALTDARFLGAAARLRAQPYGAAFDPAQGIDAAIVLAAAGLAVAPMDRRSGQVLGPKARGIDEAAAVFSKAKTAWVGFAPAQAPFHTLLTDSLRTLFAALEHDERFAPLQRTIAAGGGLKSAGPFPDRAKLLAFHHGMILVARQLGDRIESVSIETPGLRNGSIVLAAGWMEGFEAKGGARGGLAPAPAQLARRIAQDPRVLQWLTLPQGGLLVEAR